MLKRNVILGGLIAGAFLLPSVASAAGVVKGKCANCHTMHDSQDGAAVNTGSNAGQHASLLKGKGCVGCHADGQANVATTGVGDKLADSKSGAPQVDGDGTGFINAAGYFNASGSDSKMHNVAGIATADAAMLTAGFIPGSTTPYTKAIGCQDCHTKTGHHNGASTYRMLETAAATVSPNEYHPGAVAGDFPGNRDAVTYNAANMNLVCAGCHGGFHGLANTKSGTDWVRHPTNVDVATSTQPSVVAARGEGITYNDTVVVGDKAGAQTVMCISCHVAHGGPNDDLLAFTYGGSGSYAGDGDASTGCETCHNYGSGM